MNKQGGFFRTFCFVIALVVFPGASIFCYGNSTTIKYGVKIVNEDNIPIPGAFVSLGSDTASTDSNGFVKFNKSVTGIENQTPVAYSYNVKIYSSAGNVIFDMTGAKGVVGLEIYNILGQSVTKLKSAAGAGGSVKIIWRNAFGRLSNGVYPYRISSENFSSTGALVLKSGMLGVKRPVISNAPQSSYKSNINGEFSAFLLKVQHPDYDTLIQTLPEISSDSVFIFSLKVNKYNENLIYDPSFSLKVEHNNTPEQVQFLFWDKYIIGNGKIRNYSNTVQPGGITANPVSISSNNDGAGSKLVSTIWFWNYPRLLPSDNLSFGVYVKCNIVKGASLTVNFIDRMLNTIWTETQTVSNTKINEYEYITLNNVKLPISSIGEKFEGVFGVTFELSVDADGAKAVFALPMANIGSKTLRFIDYDNKKRFKNYKGLENLTEKLISKKDVTMVYMGDSITHRYDDSQTGIDSSYSTLFSKWITTKFRVKVDKRNNGGDGSWDQSAFAIYQKMGLEHNPDFILFANCRNQSSFRYPGAMEQRFALAESMIRRGKMLNSNTDMLIWVPMYEIQDSKRDTAAYNYDQEHIRQNNELVEHYGITTAWPQEKMKDLAERGVVSWFNWFGSGNQTVTDRIHQTQIGCYLFCDELKHAIAGSMFGTKINAELPKENLSALTKDIMSPTTYYASDFGKKQGSVKYGNWVQDENMVNTGNLSGLLEKGFGVELGEYPQPIRTTSENDYIEVKWTGKNFGIWFMDINGRGDAEVIVDGVSGVYKHIEGNAINTVCFPRVFTFGVGWQSLGFNLKYGDHTLKIKQKNIGPSNSISVALLVVF
jgi:hypothetical protein